jgi:hypothetical protein
LQSAGLAAPPGSFTGFVGELHEDGRGLEMLTAIIIFVGVLMGITLMLMPTFAIWTLLILSMVVVGPIRYFVPALDRIQWAVVLVSLALLFRAAVAWLQERSEGKISMPPFFTAIVLLLLSIVVTTLINRQFVETLVTSKNFFQFLSIPLAFYLLVTEEKTSDGIMKALVAIAVLQLPVAIIERVLSSGLDTVSGTFGGSLVNPSPNSALAIFLTVETGIVLGLALNRVIAWRSALLLSLCFIIPIYFTNARAIIAFFPVMFLILFGKYFLKKPLASMLITVVLAGMFSSVLYLHYKLGWKDSRFHDVKDFPTYVEESISSQLGLGARQMNRSKAVAFWWGENTRRFGKTKMFFGHGLGASRSFGIVKGHVAEKPEYKDKNIGLTVLSRLLWDVGIVGAIFYIMVFLTAFFTAGRLSKDPFLNPAQNAFMIGAQIACLFLVISIPYKQSLINIQAFNAFSMFILGYIAFWYKRLETVNVEAAA